MKPMRNGAALGVATILGILVGPHTTMAAAETGRKLIYDGPARKWTEALPVGNGRIGAMIFGGVEQERLQINESTLWGGTPHDYANPDAATHLDEIRRLIFAGNVRQAEALSARVMGQPRLLMPFQPFCDLRLDFPGHVEASGYRRELLLEEAVATTSYELGGARYTREVFASYPDQVLIVRLTASLPGRLAFNVRLDSPQPATRTEGVDQRTLQLTGQIQPRENPLRSWIGSWDRPGLQFAAVVSVTSEGGSIRQAGGHLAVTGATAATIVFSNATSFLGFRDISGDALGRARGFVEAAARQTYDGLRARHVADFRPLFSRVQLRLGDDRSTETTDRRIARFAESEDPDLVALHYAFGRYLVISSSRPGGQPANLQGIWNEELLPPWGSKLTTNINFQMNYWLADAGDLWETEEPLWTAIGELRIAGARTAAAHYRARGWVVHHNTDLWRATAPLDGPWGLWPMGQAWLANQMWDHYEFSRDEQFLRRHAYPAMKEAALFVLDTLVPAPEGTRFAGRLVTNPSTSPENQYVLDGNRVHLTYAATMDIQLIAELFRNCARASNVLSVDTAFSDELRRVVERLPPLQIGARGQLQEWIADYAEVEPDHRHLSHLYALYPGHGISLERTPGLAEAARRSLELRGDGGTGWALVWKAALWARLRDADRAYACLKRLIATSTLPNLFALHPPFQIDGNLGGTAAATEMLVQSTPQSIRILPALPARWPDGSLTGVRVRGGARLDVTWRGGRLVEVRLRSDRPASYTLHYGRVSAEARVGPGGEAVLDGSLKPAAR